MMLLAAHGEYERDFMARLMRDHVVLDDVGAESSVNDYGVKYEILTDFIMRYNGARERFFVDEKDKPRGRLFISTERRIANGLANGKSIHSTQYELGLNWDVFRGKMKKLSERFAPYYKGLCAWRRCQAFSTF